MLIKLNININELKKAKNSIFSKTIDIEKKNKIIKKINEDVKEILKDLKEKKDNELDE